MATRAISGTRSAFKELVDGTLRVQVDIDPEFRRDFLRLFPDIDTRIALAPIKANAKAEPELKGGELARLAGILCNDPEFQAFLSVSGEEAAADAIRKLCGVTSRAELDHNEAAAAIFHAEIRKPWLERNA